MSAGRRRVGTALAVLLTLLAGGRLLGLGLADQWADADPEQALAWRADHPLALTRRAEQMAADGQTTAALALARRALTRDPLAARAYRVLAEAAVASDDPQGAHALYRIVARHDPRDLASRLWLLNRHLELQDATAAVGDLDALLRAAPRLLPGLTTTVIGLASLHETQAALVAALARDPPWRASVLGLVVAQAPDRDAVARLLARLRLAPGGVDPALDQAFIERLIRDRQFAPAYLAWVAGLAPDEDRAIGNLFNGDFAEAPSNQGFDWRIDPVNGARAERLPADPPAHGLALRLAFDDQRVAFAHLRQLLLLAPGRYRFESLVKLDELHNDRGLVWEIACAEDGRVIASSAALAGTAPWHELAFDLAVPTADCQAQWLRLRLPARIAAEQRIAGAIWFDQLRIDRR